MIRISPTPIGVFEAQPGITRGIDSSVETFGVVIGSGQQGQALAIPMFGPRTTEIIVVGGVGLVKVIALRALGIGARVWVETDRPDEWERFVRSAAGVSGMIHLADEIPPVVGSDPRTPTLVIVDQPDSEAADVLVGGEWVTILTVVEELDEQAAADLPHADLVVFHRLHGRELAHVGRTFGLGDGVDVLASVPSDVLVVAARTGIAPVRLRLTSVERWLIGAVDRLAIED
ncbi:hypothetical protein [Blastococcus sp. Marseille-P5729]|uniref:hypothetical protein n=1 Tax=Blastococcus sp. Marseille-P5729 TaxID=2086582 RepID=UPI000D0E509B|nr:hypothetical protein [Blastococcus sp. Marseille-P5729]